MSRIIALCRRVPLLPVVILSVIPVAVLWNSRPWSHPFWFVDPSIGQWIVIVLVVYTVIDTLRGMIDDIRHGHVGVDVLAVVAILSTLAVQEYWASWAVVLMIASGEAIEEYAQAKAENNLTALMDAAPQTAHVMNLPGIGGADARHDRDEIDGSALADRAVRAADSTVADGRANANRHWNTVPVDRVRPGDVLQVLPGETVPVDGELLSESATLDLSNINGEPVPREVFAGARVMSGAVNGSTTLTMRATELSRDSQYQRILELVQSAQNSRAAVVKTADLMAVPFTVISFIIACTAWIVSGVPTRFAQVLVLATPCPLLIAAPVAYMAGTGRLAKAGILIKAQDVLENLGRVSHIFFDKTGTLTVKKPQVVRVDMPIGVVGTDAALAGTNGVTDATENALAVHNPNRSGDNRTDDTVASAGTGENPHESGDNSADSALRSAGMAPGAVVGNPAVASAAVRPALNEDHILMLAGVVEGYSVHILAKGIAAAGTDAIERLHARYDAGQRLCPENGTPGHGRAYPVVRNIVEDAGNGISGEVNGHTVRVGRFAYATAGMTARGAVASQLAGFRRTAVESAAMSDAGTLTKAQTAVHTESDTAGSNRLRNGSADESRGSRDGFRRISGSLDGFPDDSRNGSHDGFRSTNGFRLTSGFRMTASAATARTLHADRAAQADRARRRAVRDAIFPADHFAALAPDEMATYVAVDGRLVARIVLRDVPRANTRESLERLRALGVDRLSMITGDKIASARTIASEVGIDDVKAELFPEGKVQAVKDATRERPNAQPWWDRLLQKFVGESTTKSVTMMVGDGVNDAPVLAAADIGMAITDGTSTAASESAQVVIMNDDIAAVPSAIAIARRTKRVMLQAVTIGLGLALVCMIAAAFNLIPVVIGAFMQEAIDVVSILWALTALIDRE
ncbi:HAD-IC family P-type ATPase [Bifidobacterium callimiconis]|uniref:ATPase n=1 Tax=Bifidobacterium callimiconis TaxID=2306973 RepID=A0A430F9C9_9BIFI|nr:HAD-IC family P-type ATPase [Bifidobacterium callimiconis]RSX49434.1 ATPase [Bifidobacterium callimiconis]